MPKIYLVANQITPIYSEWMYNKFLMNSYFLTPPRYHHILLIIKHYHSQVEWQCENLLYPLRIAKKTYL